VEEETRGTGINIEKERGSEEKCGRKYEREDTECGEREE